MLNYEKTLEHKTNKVILDGERLFNNFMKQGEVFGFDMFENMSTEDFKMLKKSLKIYKDTKDLAITQAKTIDEMSNTIKSLVDANAELSNKMDEILKKLNEMSVYEKMV